MTSGIVGGDLMLGTAKLIESNSEGLAVATVMPRAALRLLVIDDDNLHRMIICRVAARAGYLPAGAATYDEAARLLRETAYDFITLDLSLGQHAGVEVLRHLWATGCKAPIIISGCDTAACSETVRVAKSLNLNILPSVSKPVDLAVLRTWLDRFRAEREELALAAQTSPA